MNTIMLIIGTDDCIRFTVNRANTQVHDLYFYLVIRGVLVIGFDRKNSKQTIYNIIAIIIRKLYRVLGLSCEGKTRRRRKPLVGFLSATASIQIIIVITHNKSI